MGPSKSQVNLLHQTSKIVSSGLTLDAMLKELVRLTVEVTACDACLVYLAEPTGEIVLRASQLPHTREIGSIRMKLGEGVTGWVAEHRQECLFHLEFVLQRELHDARERSKSLSARELIADRT